MTNRIEIYDTTLRDGTQGEGISFSVADKCRVAEELDALGVDIAPWDFDFRDIYAGVRNRLLLIAGGVPGVDQATQRALGLLGPRRAGVRLRGVGEVSE